MTATLKKKFTRIGNSWGIIIPSELLKLTGINPKDEFEMEIKKDHIVIKPINLKDHKVMKTFLSVLEDYNQTLKKLAK